jgi:hypothetical protein
LKSWVANHINLVWATDSSGRSIHSFVEVLHGRGFTAQQIRGC